MKKNNIFFKVFNEESILIQWNDKVSIKLIYSIISYKNLIEKELKEALIECVQSINSMMVIYNPNKINSKDLINILKKLSTSGFIVTKTKKKIWSIPVCYDISFGIDLKDLSTFDHDKGYFQLMANHLFLYLCYQYSLYKLHGLQDIQSYSYQQN